MSSHRRAPRALSLCAVGLLSTVAGLTGCVRTGAPRLDLPNEILHATGRSTRPVEVREVNVAPAPAPPPPRAAVIPALAGAVTPVNAQAQAPLPTVPLEPRLASLLAHEQARLDAMTQGLEQMTRWQSTPAGGGSQLAGPQAVEALAREVEVRDTPTGAQARVTWSPLEAAPPDAPPAPAPPRIETVALDEATRQQMEREAGAQAMSSLRSMVVRTEVQRGKTLAQWMREEQIPPERLDEILSQSRIVRSRVGMDADQVNHFCEVELEFDTLALQSLL